jgi:predicted DNA-binding transcriptional regulator AlpA
MTYTTSNDATTSTTAHRAKRSPVAVPLDFPHPARLGGTQLFEAVLGIAPSTFARWRSEGKIPAPIMQGKLCKWRETVMAELRDNGVA